MAKTFIHVLKNSKSEILGSFFITSFFSILLYKLDVYKMILTNQDKIMSILLYVITSYLGMIGIILAGLGIAITILDPDVVYILKKLETKNAINTILRSYYDLSFIVSFQIFYSLFLYILLLSDKNLAGTGLSTLF